MQVVIFEGVSRLIRDHSHIGIVIPSHTDGEEDLTLTHLQYADDTTGLCCTIAAVMIFLVVVAMVGRAMTSRLNRHKTLGLVLGVCPPTYLLEQCDISWAGITSGTPHMLIALGTPFSHQCEVEGFWQNLTRTLRRGYPSGQDLLAPHSMENSWSAKPC